MFGVTSIILSSPENRRQKMNIVRKVGGAGGAGQTPMHIHVTLNAG